jgi:hypothetical protein
MNKAIINTLAQGSMEPLLCHVPTWFNEGKQISPSKVKLVAIDALTQMPDLLASQVQMCYPQLGQALFGLDALTSDGVCLKEPVRQFVDTMTNTNWVQLWSWLSKEREKIGTLKTIVEQSFHSASHFTFFVVSATDTLSLQN